MPPGLLTITPSALFVTSTRRLWVALPACGHPRFTGPSTVIEAELLTMSFGLSCMVAKICATPQFVFGETNPGAVNCATCVADDCHVTWSVISSVLGG